MLTHHCLFLDSVTDYKSSPLCGLVSAMYTLLFASLQLLKLNSQKQICYLLTLTLAVALVLGHKCYGPFPETIILRSCISV